MNITFNETEHTYHVDGRLLPSVTQVLKVLDPGKFDRIPPDVLEYARARGVAVHKAIELDIAGELDWDSLDLEVRAYVDDWHRAQAELGLEVILSEYQVAHPLGYAGTLDLYASMGRKQVVLDIKTSATVYPEAGPQTAAYARALTEMLGEKKQPERAVLHLTGTGYRLVPFTSGQDWAVFLACLQVTSWRNQNNG